MNWLFTGNIYLVILLVAPLGFLFGLPFKLIGNQIERPYFSGLIGLLTFLCFISYFGNKTLKIIDFLPENAFIRLIFIGAALTFGFFISFIWILTTPVTDEMGESPRHAPDISARRDRSPYDQDDKKYDSRLEGDLHDIPPYDL